MNLLRGSGVALNLTASKPAWDVSPISIERVFVAAVLAGVAAPIAWVAGRAFGIPSVAMAGIVVPAAVLAAWRIARVLPAWIDGARHRRPALALGWALLGLLAVVQVTRLSLFMADPNAVQHSLTPWNDFSRHHSCLTSFVVAAHFERAGYANIYDPELYGRGQGPPQSFIGPFGLDLYEYPPTFLPLALLATRFAHDFFRIRMLWFALGAALFALTLVLQVRALDGAQRRFVALLSPALFIAMPMLMCQQLGNFQIMAFVLPMLALFALESGRTRSGAAVLAAVIVGKIFPGILGIDLLARRKWREAGWTAAFGALLLVMALVVVRWETFRAFFSFQLPRLSDGTAFPWMELPDRMVRMSGTNFGIYGLVKKLQALHVVGMNQHSARIVSQIYGVAVIAIAALASRRRRETVLARAQLWLALLTLASLRAPFVPSVYATIGTVWLILLIAAERPDEPRWLAGWGLAFLALQYIIPDGPVAELSPIGRVAVGGLQQVLVLAVNLWVPFRRYGASRSGLRAASSAARILGETSASS